MSAYSHVSPRYLRLIDRLPSWMWRFKITRNLIRLLPDWRKLGVCWRCSAPLQQASWRQYVRGGWLEFRLNLCSDATCRAGGIDTFAYLNNGKIQYAGFDHSVEALAKCSSALGRLSDELGHVNGLAVTVQELIESRARSSTGRAADS